VARSTNQGASWQWVNQGLTNLQVSALALSPTFTSDHVLFAATRGGGIFRSTSAGSTWVPKNSGIADLRIVDVEVAPNKLVYAIATGAGVYRSNNGGGTWATYSSGLDAPSPQSDSHFRDVAISPGFISDKTVFLAMFEGLKVSQSKGESWRETNVLTVKVNRGIGVSAGFASDGTIFVGTLGGGVLKSQTGGETWEVLGRGLTYTYINPVGISPSYPVDRTIFAGTAAGLFKSTTAGDNWALLQMDPNRALYARELAISPDYGQDHVLFASAEASDGVFRSNDGGVTWTSSNIGLPPTNVIRSIEVSPTLTADQTVYVGLREAGVFKSVDGGGTWTPARSGIESLSVEDLAISPAFRTDRTLFAATAEDGIFKSTDGGASWTSVGHSIPFTRTSTVAVSPQYEQDQTVFQGTFQGGIYRSEDGGATWSSANGGLLPNEVRRLRLSPDFSQDHVVFAGTSSGLHRSDDGGANWVRVQTLNRYEDHPDHMLFRGRWLIDRRYEPSGTSQHFSNTVGNSVTFDLDGVSVTWIGSRGPNHGRAAVYLDGQYVRDVDLHSAGYEFRVSLGEFTGLAPGWHRFAIKVLKQINDYGFNGYVTIDAFDVVN